MPFGEYQKHAFINISAVKHYQSPSDLAAQQVRRQRRCLSAYGKHLLLHAAQPTDGVKADKKNYNV